MKRWLSIVWTVLACITCSGAAEIVVKAGVVDQDKPIFVGQRVRIWVDALVPEGWVGISKINLGDVEGALVLDRNPGGVTVSESINGRTYSGQRKEISIYPQRSGTIEIPAFTLELQTRTWGADAVEQAQQKEVPGLSFSAFVPEGATSGTGLVASPALKATQSWSPETDEWVVGDAVERIIRIEADDLPGMLFQPLETVETPGMAVYPRQARIEDKMDRGQLRGTRQDAATLVFESAGSYSLPDVTLQWFDLKSGTLKTETLPGRTFTVQAEEALPTGTSNKPLFFAPTGVLVLLLLLAAGLRPVLRRTLERVRASERAAFQQVSRTARNGSSKALLNALLKWGGHLDEGFRLDTFISRFGDTADLQSLELFYAAVWTDRTDENGRMLQIIHRARKSCLRRRKQLERQRKLLPPLNP